MTFKGTLYDFQDKAVGRMLDRGSFLLAFIMGLGKTPTTIAAIEELIDSGEVKTVLIVALASIKLQWKDQIEKFTDGALVKVIDGPKPARTAQYRAVKRGDVEYVIMNYEQVVNDWDIVRHLRFDVIVCDEITAIKSASSQRTQHLQRLGKLNKGAYRFGLTGQPIENRPEELFTIMRWVDDSVLGPENIFDKTFVKRNSKGQVLLYKNLPLLKSLMESAMERKTRHDVKDQLPAIIESSYLIDLDRQALSLYKKIAREIIDLIKSTPTFGAFNVFDHYAGVNTNAAQGQVMARISALRMLCDDPRLLSYSAEAFDDPDTILGSQYAAGLKKAGLLDGLKHSPKLDVTLERMNEILDESPENKIVLFSFYKPMLGLIADHLKCDYALYTGDIPLKVRHEELKRFQTDPTCRVFLSSDAGGVGVDIPQANYLLSYDLPWSAGKWEQRISRIIRISSLFPEITLYSMLIRGSIEERMYDMLVAKSAIASAWLDGEGVNKRGQYVLTLGTLIDFLQDNL